VTETRSNSPELAESRPATSRARSFVSRRKAVGRVLLVLLGLVVIGVALAYRLASHGARKPPVISQPLPPNTQQQLAGYSFTRSEGGRQVFTVHAQRTLTFKGGERTTLDGVEIEIFSRNGQQHDLLRTDRCEYSPGPGNFSCLGPVEIELGAPEVRKPPANAAPNSVGSSTLGGRQTVYLETSGLSYDQNSSLLTSAARVRWRYSPASGSATGLVYSPRDGWIELKEAVAASLPVRGSARAPKSTILELQAAHLRYARDQRQMDLAGPVSLSEDSGRLTAGHATIYFDSQDRPTGALLDGGVRATDETPGSPLNGQAATVRAWFEPSTGDLKEIEAEGGVQARRGPGAGTAQLEADRIAVSFEGTHFHPSQGTASGNVHLAAEAAPQTPSQSRAPLAASGQSRYSYSREEVDTGEVRFTLRPADGTLDHAQTAGPGRVVLVPADSKAGKRVVTAGQFLVDFDRQGRLANVRGLAPTEIVFEPAPGAPEKTATMRSQADNLRADFDPAAAALRSLVQSGRFQFVDADMRATADHAEYAADNRILKLTGDPRLAEPDSWVRADRFVLHLDTDTAEGFGHVASSHAGPVDSRRLQSSESSRAPSANGSGARPAAVTGGLDTAVPGAGDTTNVLADRVTADRNRQVIHYEGHVRAWRGSDVLESPSLDIYTSERRIVSGSPVVTFDLAPAASKQEDSGSIFLHSSPSPTGGVLKAASSRQSAPQRGSTEPVTIRSDHVEYFDLSRKAVYQGHVRMDGSGATLQADRLEAYFSRDGEKEREESPKLERAAADGHVTIVEPGRRATGDRAEYFAVSGKIVMTGGPPTLYDSEKGFATGRSLTFSLLDDSLLIDGGPGSSAISKHRLSR
jgi:lipopolysaccharide export system protein LptA